MFISKAKLKEIEQIIAQLVQDKKCAQGVHKWIMTEMSYGSPPYVRCSHCYAVPEKKP
jgi:hypothetical protein